MGIYVNTYETANVDFTDGEIAKRIEKLFDMRPVAIERRLKLRTPIYSETTAYGHMGRASEIKTVTFKSANQEVTHKVETFTWEKLDYVKKVKEVWNLNEHLKTNKGRLMIPVYIL